MQEMERGQRVYSGLLRKVIDEEVVITEINQGWTRKNPYFFTHCSLINNLHWQIFFGEINWLSSALTDRVNQTRK